MRYALAREALFRLPPETAHRVTLSGLCWARRIGILPALTRALGVQTVEDPVRVMGLDFPNRVGLAAGLDKDGDYLDELAALGFGFIELGTVTPRPQPGNPKPRLFRLTEAGALINRMGFNNKGVAHLVERVRRAGYEGVLGINIGKNFDTPNERVIDDYLFCLRAVYPYAGYVAINISSPNTQGLRELQDSAALDALLERLTVERHDLVQLHGRRVPLAIKIAPDLSDDEVADIARAALAHGIDGLIATNTTTDREGVDGLRHADEAGGLSGRPLFRRATDVLDRLNDALEGRLPIIGVGGIDDAERARAKLAAGASLVQLYTGLIYRGPALIARMAAGLADMERAETEAVPSSANRS